MIKGIAEIREWIARLSVAELRAVTLLGKLRSGSKPSQHLQLYDWLRQGEAEDLLPESLQRNLPTLLHRLKQLIVDALRMLEHSATPEEIMHSALEEARILARKGLLSAALKVLAPVEQEAIAACKFEIALQALQIQRRLLLESAPGSLSADLTSLSAREGQLMLALGSHLRLRQLHDRLLALARQALTARNSAFEQEVNSIRMSWPLEEICQKGSWLERSLAGNVRGIISLFDKDHAAAFEIYRSLLEEWCQQPGWQTDEPILFLNIYRNYQNACFLLPQSDAQMEASMALLPSFNHLPTGLAFEQQYLMFRARIVLILTHCRFELLSGIHPEVVAWVEAEYRRLGESRSVALLFNLAVAEFLHGNWSAANRLLLLIQRLGIRHVREDILGFLRVFHAILHYELGNSDLNEYLIRSARRHFSRNSFEDRFELNVLQCLQVQVMEKSGSARAEAWEQLASALQGISAKLATTQQIVGLMEVTLWTRSKIQRNTLRSVYEEELRKAAS